MIEELIKRYPALSICQGEIQKTVEMLIQCYENSGKLMICGNGGSCADAEHIVGELMKGFLKKRPLSQSQCQFMKEQCPMLENAILEKLQQGLPAIALPSFAALNTAFCNDVEPELVYAQALMGLGKKGDIVLCISTSGNASNILAAAKVAKALGLTVIGLTGMHGGRLKDIADICICVPESETYKVQELHLPVYHYLCASVESHFYEE